MDWRLTAHEGVVDDRLQPGAAPTTVQGATRDFRRTFPPRAGHYHGSLVGALRATEGSVRRSGRTRKCTCRQREILVKRRLLLVVQKQYGGVAAPFFNTLAGVHHALVFRARGMQAPDWLEPL